MKKVLLLMMAIATVALSSSAATKIYVCGTKITGTTSFSAGGGTVSYNNNTRELTINNVSYTKTGANNNGISVDDVPGDLTINLVGTVTFDIGNADAVLCKSGKATTINISGNSYFYCRSKDHAGLKLQDGDVTVQGSGGLSVYHTAYGHAVKGGAGSEKLTLQIKNCGLYSSDTRLYHLNKVTINPTGSYGSDDYTTKIILKYYNSDNGYAAASSVSNWSAGSGVKILKPFEYYNTVLSNLSGSSFTGETIITDVSPVAVLNSTYFPDANFRGYLLRCLFPKGYITTSDVNATTNMNASSEYISSLQGLGYFTKLVNFACEENNLTWLPALPSTLKTLRCRKNKLTSLPSLPSGLTYLECDNNQLTSLPSLPSTLQSLYCENNKLSGQVNISNISALKTVDISYNPSMTSLLCYNCALTSLNLTGCTGLTTLQCYNNQLTSLPNIPTSIQTLYCNNNKLSGEIEFMEEYTNLKTLNISNNPYMTVLVVAHIGSFTSIDVRNCSSMNTLCVAETQVTSLDLSGCSSLNRLQCSSNKLSSVSNLPTTLYDIDLRYNNFSGTFQLVGRNALKYLQIGHNSGITTVNCYNNPSLESLYVEYNSNLTTLNCYNNALTELKVNGCTKLNTINCSNNKFNGSLTIMELRQLKTLDVSNNPSLLKLLLSYNALTSLNVQGCTALRELWCDDNKLSSLSVQGCNSLTFLDCCLNQIKGAAMTSLVNSLRTIPAGSTGEFHVLYPSTTEGNVITDDQVRAARNKRWIPMRYLVDSDWAEIPVTTPGDVNGDGSVTSADVTALYDVLLNNDYTNVVNGDQNGDGNITSADITAVYDVLLGNN